MPLDIKTRNGTATGPFREPHNASQDEKGSIHDDGAAQDLGFRGGTVAGSIHMEQFPPFLAALYGDDWYAKGGLSLYFTNATLDGEAVACFADSSHDIKRDGAQTRVWMEDKNGMQVCEGSASCSGVVEPQSVLRQRLKSVRPADELRIMKSVEVGTIIEPRLARLTQEEVDLRLPVVTEPLDVYTDKSQHGHRVAPPAAAINLLREVERDVFQLDGQAVGLFGGIELQLHKGPIFTEYDYEARGKILALSSSPKTEIVWFESVLRDPASGEDIATLLMMTRLMKASSPLWDTE